MTVFVGVLTCDISLRARQRDGVSSPVLWPEARPVPIPSCTTPLPGTRCGKTPATRSPVVSSLRSIAGTPTTLPARNFSGALTSEQVPHLPRFCLFRLFVRHVAWTDSHVPTVLTRILVPQPQCQFGTATNKRCRDTCLVERCCSCWEVHEAGPEDVSVVGHGVYRHGADQRLQAERLR